MEQKQAQPHATYIAGIGAANLDALWQSNAAIHLRDSNPARRFDSVGGVTRNICENIARLGQSVSLLTMLGDDADGDRIVFESERAGVDMSRVRRVPGAKSSSYIAVIDETGDMLVGLSDMRIMQGMDAGYVDTHAAFLRDARFIVCDGTLPAKVMERLTGICGGKCIADPVSIAYAGQLKPFAGRMFCVKPNRYELEVLSGMRCDSDAGIERAAECLLAGGTHTVLVSLGARGCYYADRNGRRFFRSMEPLEQMADATGAGDAFLAGFTVAMALDLPVTRCVGYALAAGRIAAMSEHTVSREMSLARIEETLKLYGDMPG